MKIKLTNLFSLKINFLNFITKEKILTIYKQIPSLYFVRPLSSTLFNLEGPNCGWPSYLSVFLPQIYVQNHKNPTILFFSHFLSPLVRSVTDCVQLGVAVSKRRTDDQGRLQRNWTQGSKTWKGKKSKSQESSKLHTQTNWILAIKLDVNLWCNHIR